MHPPSRSIRTARTTADPVIPGLFGFPLTTDVDYPITERGLEKERETNISKLLNTFYNMH